MKTWLHKGYFAENLGHFLEYDRFQVPHLVYHIRLERGELVSLHTVRANSFKEAVSVAVSNLIGGV